MIKKKVLPYISATVSSTIFGFSFMFSKLALDVSNPFTLLSFRFLTAFTIMTFLICMGVIKVNYANKPLKGIFLLGIIHPVIYFIFESFGIKNSYSSEAGLMIALIPVFVALLGSYILKEKLSLVQWLFITLSVSGVAFITIINNSHCHHINIKGTILLFVAVICASIFNILSRKISTHFSSLEITYFMITMGALFFNIISILLHVDNGNLGEYFVPIKNIEFLASIGYLGILSSIVALLLNNYTLSKIKASKSSVFSNLSTIIPLVAGVIFLNECFNFYHILGSLMILLGVWGTNHFENKKTNCIKD